MALALNCSINKHSSWARKNYFYPDLSKGYQITQFEEPLAQNGYVIVEAGKEKQRIGVTRLHLEEDAAKNIHSADKTLVDFNRAGAPLAEIVTEPDFRSAEAAKAFLQKLRLLARYLKVSDADMEKGHLRCDANISLRPVGKKNLYPKTEIKNLNSFRSVERALNYEIKRQTELWETGKPVSLQSTRGWDENKLKTVEQRDKEESADYRYFPEPDLPDLNLTEKQIKEIQSSLPELPQEKIKRLVDEYEVNYQDAKLLAEDPEVANYFEKVMMESRTWLESLDDVTGSSDEIWAQNRKRLSKLVNGYLTSQLFKLMSDDKKTIEEIKITPENFAEFISLIYQGKVNSSAAQTILKIMYDKGKDPSDIMEDKNLGQLDNLDELSAVVDQVIKENPEMVKQYQAGKEALMKFFIGCVMKKTKGTANPELAAKLLREIVLIHKP